MKRDDLCMYFIPEELLRVARHAGKYSSSHADKHVAPMVMAVVQWLHDHPMEQTPAPKDNDTLTRIADALDRAFPIPEVKKPGKLKPGVAEYHHEDPQTLELRNLRDGSKETSAD